MGDRNVGGASVGRVTVLQRLRLRADGGCFGRVAAMGAHCA
ncbi:hypothetical protein MMSP_5165 [Mycobacterium sp. 012931]|nr:hypothetical protein MMSP_5165 [Mycobacterium sp. 012931]